MLPAFLRPGRPAGGGDAALGIVLRIAGVAALGLAAFGVAMAAMGAWVLLRMQAGDRTGWDGLIGGVALMLGAMMVLGGALVAAGAHAAFAGWRDLRHRPVGTTGWVFLVVGVLAGVPAYIFGSTPLDLYVLVAGVVVAGLGVAMLVWARAAAP